MQAVWQPWFVHNSKSNSLLIAPVEPVMNNAESRYQPQACVNCGSLSGQTQHLEEDNCEKGSDDK